MKSEYMFQGIYRVFALSLPLLVIVFVRNYVESSSGELFFGTLTDVVLVCALLKLGLDTYIPTCSIENNKVIVSKNWLFVWQVVQCVLICIAIVLIGKGNSKWIVAVACILSLSSMLYAEKSRLYQSYLFFYLCKAPSIYISALILVFLSGISWKYDFALIVCVIFIAFLVSRNFVSRHQEIGAINLAWSGLLSLVIVVFSWKEAFVSRYIFNSEDLSDLVFFSRLMILVTFLFMLRNARIPNEMREQSNTHVKRNFVLIANKRKEYSILWAVLTSILVVIYASLFESNNLFGALFLSLSAIVLVSIGNLIACLIYLRKYVVLVLIHGSSFLIFVCMSYILGIAYDDTFTLISFSSLISQICSFAFMCVYIHFIYQESELTSKQ